MAQNKENNLQPEDNTEKKYSEALSRNPGEGGYAFLKRVLSGYLKLNAPIMINSGKNYFLYVYREGQSTFMDGITILENNDEEDFEAFKSIAEGYDVSQGTKEIKEQQL